ncbi:uncharacterized protein N7477_005021 [Penicillium maclennaniae]|uniref:uncharacterized protein n=1 Tax=Penicillium maclennaniae TaxID=1343394 RepID=UPI00253FA109|nr:uncharacterized protein N7477_005021 [Penicillium maclennaniae]KAJ5675087.1 hypothetical protein N7477_005021 [Penicillium maclennaniae]
MTFLQDSYKKLLNKGNAPLAANVSLIYVPTTTRIDGADAVASHVRRQASIVEKQSEEIINVIESSNALCLDIEVTLKFNGGGAYLPAMDDNFLADSVANISTLHIVQFNAQNEIQQVRIYWDQAALLKAVQVIGKSARTWPIRDGKEQIRLLRNAATQNSEAPAQAPSQGNDLPSRPASPGKRYIKDPYAADSLFDLLSSNHTEAPHESEEEPRKAGHNGKRYIKDPYAAESLTELISPTKPKVSAVVRPYGGARPNTRSYGDLFVTDDDDEIPGTPSKAERVTAPRAGSRFQGSRIFEDDSKVEERAFYKSDPKKYDHFQIGADDATQGKSEDRAYYKSDPKKYDHFEIGANNADLEVKQEPQRAQSRQQAHWDFDDVATPKPKSTDEARSFGYSGGEADSPPARPAVHKPRRDADKHFDMTDDETGGDADRIISSYGNRGKGLYKNRLFDEENGASTPGQSKSQNEPLGVTGNNASRKNNLDAHWKLSGSPTPTKTESEKVKTISSDRAASIKQMESSWDQEFENSPEAIRPATHLHNPKGHNQPSWTYGDE